MVQDPTRYRYQTGGNGSEASAEFPAEGLRWLYDRTKFPVGVMMIVTGLIFAGNGVAPVASMIVAFSGAISLVVALRVPTANEINEVTRAQSVY